LKNNWLANSCPLNETSLIISSIHGHVQSRIGVDIALKANPIKDLDFQIGHRGKGKRSHHFNLPRKIQRCQIAVAVK